MSKKIFVGHKINAGVAERYKEAMVGLEAPDASVYEYVADWILDAYETRISAQFEKLGLELPESGPITVQYIRDTIKRRTGLEIEELTKDAIMIAVDKQLALQLSEKLGFEVSTVFNAETAKAEVKAQVLLMLADGRAMSFLKGPALRRLRQAATFVRAGFTPDESKKALARVYQKRYRRHHKEVWE